MPAPSASISGAEIVARLTGERDRGTRQHHRVSDVAEHGVERVRERVHDRRLGIAGDDDRAAAMRREVLHDGLHEARVRAARADHARENTSGRSGAPPTFARRATAIASTSLARTASR